MGESRSSPFPGAGWRRFFEYVVLERSHRRASDATASPERSKTVAAMANRAPERRRCVAIRGLRISS